MVTRYFKATRTDGRDFHTGTVDYGAALASGELVTHPRPDTSGAGGYLSVSVSPSDCTGMAWPCRLFAVEPVAPWAPAGTRLPSKRACHALRVVEELPAHEALGPQGVHVAALIDRTRSLTADEAGRLAARDAARDAARALVVRDLISADHYDALTMPWRTAIGPIHPDDPDQAFLRSGPGRCRTCGHPAVTQGHATGPKPYGDIKAMSTYLYLKCLDHDPPLYSDDESGQHLSALADIRADLGNRDRIAAAVSADLWPLDSFRRATMRFLAKHPRCRIGIEDEYGREHATTEGA